jgi:hypothetical protein
MSERLTGVTVPEAKRPNRRSKLKETGWQNRSCCEQMERGFLVLESFTHPAPEGFSHASNTFVAICTGDVISLLKTWVSTHTLKTVAVSRECRFVWQ